MADNTQNLESEANSAVEHLVKCMDEFEEWANKNLFGMYRPTVRTKNGHGYTNEYLNDCWDTWKAARH